MNIAVLGLGEVGSAVKKLVSQKHQVFVRELKFDEISKNPIDLLHICIPYINQDQFIGPVLSTIQELKPQLTIINSTVKPGTTQYLYQQTNANLVHAPIMGVHPHLYEYFFKFTKFIGPVNQTSLDLARQHFEDLGVKTEKFDSPFETELAKILSTTYYGWNVLFEKWVHKLSVDHQANFDQVYTRFNQNYNQGYKQERPEVVRPILKHIPGPIGGHCVLPNAKIINLWLQDDFTTFIDIQNQKLAESDSSD